MSAPQEQSATIVRNATDPLTVTISWQNLASSSGLSGYTAIWFIAKWSYLDADANAVFNKTLSSGVTITQDGNNTDTNGIISIKIAAADTASMPLSVEPLTLVFSCMGTDASGNPWPLAFGTISVLPNAAQTV